MTKVSIFGNAFTLLKVAECQPAYRWEWTRAPDRGAEVRGGKILTL